MTGLFLVAWCSSVGRAHYDAHANISAIELPNGGTWHYAFGRLVARTDPLGAVTRLHHSDRGDMQGETDALGHSTRYQYDGDGYLTQRSWGKDPRSGRGDASSRL